MAKAAGGYVSLLVPGSEVPTPLVVKGTGKLSWKAELREVFRGLLVDAEKGLEVDQEVF